MILPVLIYGELGRLCPDMDQEVREPLAVALGAAIEAVGYHQDPNPFCECACSHAGDPVVGVAVDPANERWKCDFCIQFHLEEDEPAEAST